MKNTICNIVLTKDEQDLFRTLARVVKDESLNTTVRVAGWCELIFNFAVHAAVVYIQRDECIDGRGMFGVFGR